MWLGILHLNAEESGDDVDGPAIIVYAWASDRERPFTVGGVAYNAPPYIRLMRKAWQGRRLAPPHCGSCGARVDLPLD